ncbi:hypothetical protein KJ671_03390 [Patescibacteria group bacterium]|nr:hypothetical protein [Patescibacteria group bacterium]
MMKGKVESERLADKPIWKMESLTLEHRIAILEKLSPLTENIFMEIFECKSVLIWRRINPKYFKEMEKSKWAGLIRFSCFKNCLLRFLIKNGVGWITKEKARSGDRKIAIYELVEKMSDRALKKRMSVLKGLSPPTENTLMEIFECEGVLIWRKIERQAERYKKKYGKRDHLSFTRFMEKHSIKKKKI